jgi:hypothetical protein
MADSKRFLLRLDPDLFEALRRWANDDLRSINAQIEYLLTDQARRSGRLPKPTIPRPALAASAEEFVAPAEELADPAEELAAPETPPEMPSDGAGKRGAEVPG